MKISQELGDAVAGEKKQYAKPRLESFGSVRVLTQSGSGTSTETTTGNGGCSNNQNNRKLCSERRLKENIVRIGTHPLGFGLYLFDYAPSYKAAMGEGRRFGVMIDEVEPLMPEVISVGADGYKRVDYQLLGIEHSVH